VDSYRSCEGEVDVVLEPVEGALPDGLAGTLYRNGVVGLDVHGTFQMHPFDGDGMVSRFAFAGGRVRYRNRVVETREVLEERAAGRMLYRNFGTNLPGGIRTNALRMRFKNAANTSVVRHGGRLLALWEGGQPHALDPESLACLGRFDFGGRLDNPRGAVERLLAPELPFSAHPAIDPEDGSLHNFGTLIGTSTQLVLYRVDADGRMTERRFVELPRSSFVHDFVLTPSYRVFFLTPVAFDVARALSGWSSPVDSIRRDEDAPTEVLLVPRDGGSPITIPTSASFTFHFINGYEDAEGRVVVDGCRMEDFAGGTLDLRDVEGLLSMDTPPPLPTRWVLDPRARTAEERPLSDVALELPKVHPSFETRPYRYGYGTAKLHRVGPPIHNGLARLDVRTGEVCTRRFGGADLPGEPIVVAKPGARDELDAWLLSVVYVADAHRSDLLVLEAQDLSTVARVALPHHHPPGFHGQFVPA
jgi:all-trans-8'-apo-beta-carotenal 15,15'-oxygenase